jgi:hypothetical protein
MKCQSAEKLLLEYIEDTLSPKQVGLLEVHLGDCSHCRTEMEALEKTIRLASSLPVEYPAPEKWVAFLPELWMKVEQETSAESPPRFFWSRQHAWKFAGAMCVLTLSLGLWVASLFKTPTAELEPFLLQDFTSEISVKQLQEQLNRTEMAFSLPLNYEGVIPDELQPKAASGTDAAGELSTSHDLLNQLHQVIATEIDLRYFEEEALTDPAFLTNTGLIFDSSD